MNRWFVVLVLLAELSLAPGKAGADVVEGCDGLGQAGEHVVTVGVTCERPGGETTATGAGDSTPDFIAFTWANVCKRFNAGDPMQGWLGCAAATQCPDPTERLWDLWGQRPSGEWTYLSSDCLGQPPTAIPQLTVTPAMVLEAIRRIGLPAVDAQTQPADKTLVNFETIFYAEPQTFTRSLTLLGQQVDVEATPVEYRWHHGDGTVATTTTPGAPYPAKDITYSYSDAHVTVETRVDVTYAARFRVNGGGWQDIAETVTITGPVSPLRVAEAVAVLSGDYS